VLTGHTNTIDAVAFSPDGRFVASGSHDRTVKIWNSRTGELIHTLLGHTASVQGLVFTADSEHLISVSPDRRIRFWDVLGGQDNFELPADANWFSLNCVAISRDGTRLAWGGGQRRRGEINLLDARAGWKAAGGPLGP
jgi:WD40 repeat protein